MRVIWADPNGPHTPTQYPETVFDLRGVSTDCDGNLYFRACELPTGGGIWVFAFRDYLSANQCPMMPLETNIERPSCIAYARGIDPLPPGTPPDQAASFALAPTTHNPDTPPIRIDFYGLGIRKTADPSVAWHMVYGYIDAGASLPAAANEAR